MKTVIRKFNVKLYGQGKKTIMFSHGFGCDQAMWRYVWPAFSPEYKVILFDHMGAGGSDISAYKKDDYAFLEKYADDVLEILEGLQSEKVIFVGHSVSAMIGMLAAIRHPEMFDTIVMVAPSPCYANDGDYQGGFDRYELDQMIAFIEQNYVGWAQAMAPTIMGNPGSPELSKELEQSFCKMHVHIAKQFAKVTFLTDLRPFLSDLQVPSLIMQCSSDAVAPDSVSQYLKEKLVNSTLVKMRATGHCPNLSAPEETIEVIKDYLSLHDAGVLQSVQ